MYNKVELKQRSQCKKVGMHKNMQADEDAVRMQDMLSRDQPDTIPSKFKPPELPVS